MSDDVIHGLIDVPKSEVQILLEAGYLYMEMGLFKESEDVFTGVSSLLPDSDVPRVALGNLFFAQGKFQRALKFHQEALKSRPDSAMAQAHIGESLLFLKKLDEAKKALKKAIDMEPGGPAAAFAKALLEAHDAGDLAS
jgi:tetratricopeptide (TPR) repeat protein